MEYGEAIADKRFTIASALRYGEEQILSPYFLNKPELERWGVYMATF